MTPPSARLWRVFPWDPDAPEGERFSPSYVPAGQAKGRFDLPDAPAGVLYLAETPEHAVAEAIQQYRGQALEDADLILAGRRLALVEASLPDPVRSSVADLCDPRVLLDLGIRPDESASRDRGVTQRIATAVHAAGHAGLRWWSALSGDWHTVVLFRGRLARAPEYGPPTALTLAHRAVQDAAHALGIRL